MKNGLLLGISSEAYHAHAAVNKSGLDLIEKSPLHYWADRLDPKREPRKTTPAMALGSAIHCRWLEPERFRREYGVLPEELDRRTSLGKQTYADLQKQWKHLISFSDSETCEGIAESMRNAPATEFLFRKGLAEVTYLWRDPVTGMECRARADWIAETDKGIWIVDPKSTQDASPYGFSWSCKTYKYDRQAAWYLDGFKEATGETALGFIFAAYEKSRPFAGAYYLADDAMVARGREENLRLMNVYATCRKRGEWPGYGDEIMPIGLPKTKEAAPEAPANLETY